MQLTKFTKTLNGITPSLAIVPVVHPRVRTPSSKLSAPSVPLHFSGGRKVALITDRGKKPGKRWQDISSSTRSVDGYESRLWGRAMKNDEGVPVMRGE